jgi:hypothetical protein
VVTGVQSLSGMLCARPQAGYVPESQGFCPPDEYPCVRGNEPFMFRRARISSNPVRTCYMSTRVNHSVYSAPKLIAYGDVREITQDVSNMGALDGGGAPNTKTEA